MINIPQTDWIRALTAHPSQDVIALAKSLTLEASVSFLQLPQAGLGLITLQESAFHDEFYLGEFPLSCCQIEISYANGTKGKGSAQVMADDAELAKALAILDAILAHQFRGWQDAYTYVEQGKAKRNQQDQQRKSILAKTRVDFATLDAAEH